MSSNNRCFQIPGIASAISAIMLCSIPGVAGAKALTGPQVLTQCQAAYDKLSSYQGDVTSSTDSKMARAGMMKDCSAHIVYERPGRIRVDGTGFSGTGYAYVSNGTTTEMNAFGGWSNAQSPMMAIAGATGIGMHSATTVPSTLLHIKIGGITGIQSAVPISENSLINGHTCYKVVVQSPYKTTYWVDKKTWLLVRSVEDLSSFMSGMGGSGPFLITLNMKSPILNKPIKSSVFALPKVTANMPFLNPAQK